MTTPSPAPPTPEYRPTLNLNEVLVHLILPGQAFVRLGRPWPRWAWTVIGLLSLNFISFLVYWSGERRWALLWLPVAGAAAGHYFWAARGFTAWRRDRGQALYALAAVFAWMTPMLLAPLPGGRAQVIRTQERALAGHVLAQALAAQASGGALSSGPCPARLLPDWASRATVRDCQLSVRDPQGMRVTVQFSSGHTVTQEE